VTGDPGITANRARATTDPRVGRLVKSHWFEPIDSRNSERYRCHLRLERIRPYTNTNFKFRVLPCLNLNCILISVDSRVFI
jgi:hypothetical protein